MSRRAAECAIAEGRIYVNGEKAIIGQKIDPKCDKVTLDGKIISPTQPEKLYIMLNKPRGYVTTLSDERGRPTVASLVADCGARVYPVGRLDMDSEGLLLLTNDGELTLKLTHPRHEIPKIYHVTLKGEIPDKSLEALQNVRKIDNYELAPVKVSLIERSGGKTHIEITLFEGRNRQIRKMCESVELRITQLKRIAIGELSLSNLPVGRWRHLTKNQIEYLYEKEKSK